MAAPSLTPPHRTFLVRFIAVVALLVLVVSACSAQGDQQLAGGDSPPDQPEAATSPTSPAEDSGANSGTPDRSSQPAPNETEGNEGDRDGADGDDQAALPPADGQDDPAPQPYIPAGRPGSAEGYAELLQRLEDEVPQALRADVPWPDLRNPDPAAAQVSIFELWIWMAENYPEPVLVEAMAAPGSPSREDITGVFGRLDAEGLLETRTGAGYRAFDHRVVTFESAGLPLWLGRGVPADAVVVYYSDNAGPVDVTDRDTGSFVERRPAVPTRTWLSIMVPTDVGWQLWRDQLIEPNDSELEVPDVPPPPGPNDDRRDPEV